MKVRLDSVIKSLSIANAAIKNTASPVEKEGWFPTFSASGQDVWLPEYRFNLRGIVVSAVGARCGKAFKADGKWNVCANTHALSVDEGIADRDYCWYMLNNENWWIKGGTAQPFVKVKDSLKREHVFPTLSDQKKIAKQLDQISHIIKLRQQQISALDDLIKARFVEMFGNPATNPKGWETYQLSDCLERIDNGKSFVCSDKPRVGDYPAVLKLSAATYGDYRPEENKALLDENQFVEGAEVHTGDLLFTRKNTPELVGMAAYVQETPKKLMMPDLIFRLVTNARMSPVFLWHLINCNEFRPIIQGISGGSAKSMSNISKDRLGKINVICPPRQIQDQLVPFVHQVDKSKVVVQKALDEAQILFDNLMQQYFG